MSAHATAAYYDGASARRRSVALWFQPQAVAIAEDGVVIARWAYDDIRRHDSDGGLLRLANIRGPELARLDVSDAADRRELAAHCHSLDQHDRTGGRSVVRIVAWTLAAAASLVLTTIYLVPAVADRLAPLIPVAAERRVGQAVDKQVRAIFSGKICASPEGGAALQSLSRKLIAATHPRIEPDIQVIASSVPNAVALPGGRIYLFEALLTMAASPDEVAGVLAHELGHLQHHDNMRRLIQASGTSFLLGLLFGDVTGAGALIFVGEGLVGGAYSREAESAADGFAADAMIQLGRSPRPLGVFLLRMTGTGKKDALQLLASHPLSEERLEALSKREAPAAGPPLLDDRQWQALKSICR